MSMARPRGTRRFQNERASRPSDTATPCKSSVGRKTSSLRPPSSNSAATKIDIWQISQFQPPCYIRVSYGSGPAGTGIPEGDEIWEPGHWGFQVFHGITPETSTASHQFRYILHEKGGADAASIAEFYRQNDQIINEDRIIFAIQQKALSTTGDGASAVDVKTSAIIKADGGLIRARAIISSMLQSDCASAPTRLRA